jgi:stearoyl-CoA desaturase (delta-9 desaturase)
MINLNTLRKKVFASTYQVSQIVILLQAFLAIIGFVYIYFNFSWWYVGLPFIWYAFLLWWCHHVGLHRYFSHGSFSVNETWHKILCYSSCLVSFGSPFSYALAHRAHHKNSDTDKDTHAPTKIGYLNVLLFRWKLDSVNLLDRNRKIDQNAIKAHQNYALIVLLFYIVLHLIDTGLAFTYNIGVLIALFGVAYVNVFSHVKNPLNYRNFETDDLSSNNLFVGMVGGEWHNNHHRHPQNWNQRIKWWELDIPAQIIKLIKKEENDKEKK